MALKNYKKLELASNQLETAIGLFVSGGDKFSVITLAGAADVIFCQLVLNQGEENFTDYQLKNDNNVKNKNITRQQYGREINDTLSINALKHMDHDDDGMVTMNLEECALGAILKALVNLVKLEGRDIGYVQAFFAWSRLNLDPKKYNIYGDPNWEPSI